MYKPEIYLRIFYLNCENKDNFNQSSLGWMLRMDTWGKNQS